jgi:hypothetical protein
MVQISGAEHRPQCARICNLQLHPFSGYGLITQGAMAVPLTLNPRQSNSQFPAVGHGVSGVHGQIGDNLLHLGGVGFYQVVARFNLQAYLYIFRDDALASV